MDKKTRGQGQVSKLTPAQIEDAAAAYASGTPMRRLAIHYSVSAPTIAKWFRRAGVALRSLEESQRTKAPRKPSERLSDEEFALAAKAYHSGGSLAKVASDYGSSRTYLRYLFQRRGVLIKQGSQAHRRLALDEHVFDDAADNPEAAYWVGLLFADGSVCHNGLQRKVSLGLSGEDGAHVLAFRQFVKSGHKTSPGNTSPHYGGWACVESVRISFNSTVMAAALAHHGVRPRKSLTARASAAMARNAHFWRGVVDGDGCLYVLAPKTSSRRYPVIEVCGSLASMRQFRKFATAASGSASRVYRNGNNCWKVSVTGSFALRLAGVLYDNDGPALPRKKAIALAFLREFGKS